MDFRSIFLWLIFACISSMIFFLCSDKELENHTKSISTEYLATSETASSTTGDHNSIEKKKKIHDRCDLIKLFTLIVHLYRSHRNYNAWIFEISKSGTLQIERNQIYVHLWVLEILLLDGIEMMPPNERTNPLIILLTHHVFEYRQKSLFSNLCHFVRSLIQYNSYTTHSSFKRQAMIFFCWFNDLKLFQMNRRRHPTHSSHLTSLWRHNRLFCYVLYAFSAAAGLFR